MALPALIENLEAVGEAHREHYVPITDGVNAGQHRLDVTAGGGLTLENTLGLRTALQSERGKVSAANKLLGAFDGLDAAEVKARLALFDGIESPEELRGQAAPKTAEAVEAAKRALQDKHDTEKAVWGTREKMLSGAVEKHIRRAAALSAIGEHEGNSKLLLGPVLERIKLREVGGDFEVYCVDDQGNEAISLIEGNTGAMRPSELVGSVFKKDAGYGPAFAGTRAAGSGAPGSGVGGGSAGGHSISKADAKDVGKYRAARAAASKAGVLLQIAD